MSMIHDSLLEFQLRPAELPSRFDVPCPLLGGQLRLQALQLLPGSLLGLLRLGVAVGQLLPGDGPVGVQLPGQLLLIPDQSSPLPLQLGGLGGDRPQLVQGLPDLGQLPLQLGNEAGVIVLAAVAPVLQTALHLGEGHVLVPAGHQRGYPCLQGGRAVNGGAALPQKGGALKPLPGYAGEDLAAVMCSFKSFHCIHFILLLFKKYIVFCNDVFSIIKRKHRLYILSPIRKTIFLQCQSCLFYLRSIFQEPFGIPYYELKQ